MDKLRRTAKNLLFAAVCLSTLSFLPGCKKSQPSTPEAGSQQPAPANSLELIFTYGSEKEKWIADVTDAFNRNARKTSSGKRIFVRAIPMGSGECIDEILSGSRKTHVTSPASAAFVKIGNAQSRSKTGHDLLGPTENLVLSPVVIAMWKPMAEAIGWGKKPIGWADILALSRNQQGWKSYGFPQWGQFKFGHTHPDYSNSGLISLFAETYAAVNKTAGLTLADLNKPRTGEFVAGIENSVVHYGSSTGFFGRKMFANGPQYLSASVLYESMVVESYAERNMPFPVVAIYPKEGTFWSDHPIGVVDRDWVTPEHREAAKIYIQYLLDRPQQEHAITYGFRPASVEVAVSAPIDSVHGVDPKEPKTTLEVPSTEVIDGIQKLWQQKKKSAEVVLVFDTSGSMSDDQKIQNAREGAKQLVSLLGDNDSFSLLPFNSTMNWASQDLPMKTGRTQSLQVIESLFPQGGTALYDSIAAGYSHLADRQRQDAGRESRIRAVIVLTDGEDTESKLKLPDLMSQIKFDGEQRTIRVFTIAYGRDARQDILKTIAESTQAKSYAGTPKNIVDVFRDISTFF
ncbi:MAG TPA: VWA domain-containing protein [Candidatus Solibacter sp.]|nr:VWA domain-containing protein [Candidatus Solibacter sp.]